MPPHRHAGSAFARSLADFCALACRTSPDDQHRRALEEAGSRMEAAHHELLERLAQRDHLLERLAGIRGAITRRADLKDTLHNVVAGAAALLGEEVAGLRLVDPADPASARLSAHVGLDDAALEAMRVTPSGRVSGELPSETLGAAAALAAPVRDQHGVVGSLLVASADEARTWTDDDRAVLQAFADHAGAALQDARTVADALHQAVHDALTGLPNRTLFGDRVEHALERGRRNGTGIAVLFCDLDNFKLVNDSLGHHEGDRLLVGVAHRLRLALRASDTVARFGGDEFGVLLEDVTDPSGPVRVAEQIGDLLREPFRVGSREHVMGASVGIALSGADSDSPDALVRDADAAMYRAKLRGRGGYEVFDEEMRSRALKRLRTEDELRHGIGAGELRLALQPIVSLADGLPVGAEALVRWQHPERGLLAPGEFIAIAEDSGLIVPMGTWVLREACREAAAWNGDRPLYVSVNLSPRQVGPGLIDTVAGALADTGLDPALLALEITESLLLEDSVVARETMTALKGLGVQIVLDDFGTGYSSLGYLKRLPLDGLKIDRSFVGGLGTDADDSAIVSAVAGMAGSLGLMIIAEGVETLAQVAELRRLECQSAQGFHFARPMDPGAFARSVRPSREASGPAATTAV